MNQGEKYTSKLHGYPCIYLTLKDVKDSDFEEMMLCFQTELVELFIEHAYLLKSDKLLDVEKEIYNRILNLKADNVSITKFYKIVI